MILIALAAAALCAAPAHAADAAAPAAAPAPAVTGRLISLDEAFAAALKRSEAVAQRGLTYAQVQAQISEMWSAVKPRVQLQANQFWQDTPGPNVNFPLPASQQTAEVNVHQPVFAGLRDFLAIRAARATGESAELQLLRAKQLLYQDVAQAYLNLLQSRRALATRERQVELFGNRVKELRGFVDIGRSRRSELLQAQAQQAQAQADLETARGQDRVYQHTLQFLTGLDDELSPAELQIPQAAEDEAPFLARADQRPDVRAARKDLEYSDLYVSIQRRQHWPTISFDGNYYLKRPPTFSRHINWDATLTGILPIYSGGLISAQTREAEAVRGIREQALSLVSRQAVLDVRTAHSDLTSDLSIVAALRNALTLAQANAKAQTEDYRHGLVTNLDVLAALTTVQDLTLRLDQAEMQAFDSRVRLEVAAGGPGSVK